MRVLGGSVGVGVRLMGSDSKKAQEMIAYADGVLDALGIRQGPSHMEVHNLTWSDLT